MCYTNVVVAAATALVKEDPETLEEFCCANLHAVSGLLFKRRNPYEHCAGSLPLTQLLRLSSALLKNVQSLWFQESAEEDYIRVA